MYRFKVAGVIVGIGIMVMIGVVAMQRSQPSPAYKPATRADDKVDAIVGSASPAKHFKSLSEMVQDSELVVVARVVQTNPATLVPDPTPLAKLQELGGVPGVLLTESVLEVEQVIKGDTSPTNLITIVQTGGIVDRRQHYIEGDPLFEVGERTVLFLTRIPDSAASLSPAAKYILNGTPQARFKLTNEQVVPMVSDSLTQPITALSADDFIKQVAAASAQTP